MAKMMKEEEAAKKIQAAQRGIEQRAQDLSGRGIKLAGVIFVFCSHKTFAVMKINIANPTTGMQKMLVLTQKSAGGLFDIFCLKPKIEIDDDKKLYPLFDKRMAQEVAGDTLGDEFKGYVFRIGGGNDKQGFPMKQGVLCNHRVRLLFKKGMSCYRERRKGCRKRKSVRGCIVGQDLAVLHLVMVKKGEADIPGLTDDNKPRRLGPKRASKIRKLFGLEKKDLTAAETLWADSGSLAKICENNIFRGSLTNPAGQDDVRQFVVRREVKEGKKSKASAPKIQRLITPQLLQRKRYFKALTRKRMEAGKEMKAAYQKRLSEYHHEQKEKRAAELQKKKAKKGNMD
eukprot:s943_g10.t1